MRFAKPHLYCVMALCFLSRGHDRSLAQTRNASLSVSDVIDLMHFSENDHEARSLPKPYARLFGKASTERLASLRENPNVGIALRAAWEEVVRNMPKRDDLPEDQQTGGVAIERISPQPLWFFVGFTEGRLRLRLPKWWKPWFLNARTYGSEYLRIVECRGVAFGSNLEKVAKADISGLRETQLGFLVSPEIAKIQQQGDGSVLLTLAAGGSWPVPALVLPDALDEECDLVVPAISVAAVDEKRLVIAVCDLASEDRSFLWCIDRGARTIVWHSLVWGSVSYGGRSGPPLNHVVEVRCQGETVYVFGVGRWSVYVEAFSANDGTNRFRFSTSY